MTGQRKTVAFYFDVRSPYAFIAWAEIPALEREFNVRFDPLPLAIELVDAFGDPDTRDERQTRKVKYLYMDARRLAVEKGLTIRGTVKIFDPFLAHSAFLFAKEKSAERKLFENLLPQFWNRAFDIEDLELIRGVIASVNLDPKTFDAFLAERAHQTLNAITEDAHSGAFSASPPSFLTASSFGALIASICSEESSSNDFGSADGAARLHPSASRMIGYRAGFWSKNGRIFCDNGFIDILAGGQSFPSAPPLLLWQPACPRETVMGGEIRRYILTLRSSQFCSAR